MVREGNWDLKRNEIFECIYNRVKRNNKDEIIKRELKRKIKKGKRILKLR